MAGPQVTRCRIYGSLLEGMLKWLYFMSFGSNWNHETGLEGKLIDVAPSARFKTKANPTEGGWKNCQLPLNRILADSAINTSSFWCNGKNFSTLLQEIQLLMVLYRETPEKNLEIVLMKDWTQTVILFSFTKIQFWQKNKSRHNMTSFWEDTILNADPVVWKSQENHTIRSHNHEIFTQTLNTPMTRQENHSNELFKRITGDDNIHTFFRTREWDIVNIFTCERFKLPWNQGCLQNVQEMFLK